MVFNDRLKRSFFALFKAAVPRLDYLALYTAKVIQQKTGTNLFDLAPDDSRLPPMGSVPMRLGIPGATISVRDGETVLVGFENGDPSRPYCALFDGTEHVFRLTLIADTVEIGASNLDPIRTGVLNGEAIDPFTGAQHFALGNASQHVRAKKV